LRYFQGGEPSSLMRITMALPGFQPALLTISWMMGAMSGELTQRPAVQVDGCQGMEEMVVGLEEGGEALEKGKGLSEASA